MTLRNVIICIVLHASLTFGTPDEDLFIAIESGRIDGVRIALRAGANPQAMHDGLRMTALAFAEWVGAEDIVALLHAEIRGRAAPLVPGVEIAAQSPRRERNPTWDLLFAEHNPVNEERRAPSAEIDDVEKLEVGNPGFLPPGYRPDGTQRPQTSSLIKAFVLGAIGIATLSAFARSQNH